VEEALRVRERLGAGEVVAITVGDEEAESALRRCLAMGADRAVRIDAEPLDPISTARALAPAIAAESPDLVLAGVQSADSVQGSTGTALAELVGLPRVAVVTRFEWDGSGPATVDRELEGGLVDVVEVETPALLTIQTGINQPRYANLRAIKQADQQEIAVVAAETGEPAYRVRRMFTPPRGEGAQLLDGGPAQVAERILELVQERLA
jgi:electron transfer flavoprotein alpha/beta subunit